MSWRLRGGYWEACSCSVPCPNWAGQSPPNENACHFLRIYSIEAGHHEPEDLSDLVVALVGRLEGHVADGRWEFGLYVSSSASERQAAAVGRIFRGEAAGPMAALRERGAVYRGIRQVDATLRPYPGNAWVWELGTQAQASGSPAQGSGGKPQVLQNAYLTTLFGLASDPVVNKSRVLKVADPDWGFSFDFRYRSAGTSTYLWAGED